MAETEAHATEASEHPSKRDILYIGTASFAAAGVASGVVWPLIHQLNPAENVKALASIEVDVSAVPAGQQIKVLWQGKAVFIRHRTAEDIATAQSEDNAADIKDKEIYIDAELILFTLDGTTGEVIAGRLATQPSEVSEGLFGKGAKASHLTYLGDATVGANANIGAGTITCNYDGYFKHQTTIGERAFIGSNSALIAPINIGKDAIVAAGSAVSRDVSDGELRMVRAEQMVKPGWADRFHDTMKKKKAAQKAEAEKK